MWVLIKREHRLKIIEGIFLFKEISFDQNKLWSSYEITFQDFLDRSDIISVTNSIINNIDTHKKISV